MGPQGGSSFNGSSRKPGAQIGQWLVKLVLAAVAVLLPVLFIYNRLHHGTLFLIVSVGTLTICGLVSLVVHAAALLTTLRPSILATIKGELAARWTLVATYAVKILAVIVAFTAASTFSSTGSQLSSSHASDAIWIDSRDLHRVSFSGFSEDKVQSSFQRVGAWTRERLKQDGAILAHPMQATDLVNDVGADAPPILIVTPAYLKRNAYFNMEAYSEWV